MEILNLPTKCFTIYVSKSNETPFVGLQKIIYKQLKITGAVRVIKGHEVLQDGWFLIRKGIIDGSIVNIVIEPDKEISLQMKLGPKQFTHKVKSSLQVRALKQQLIDDDIVGFPVSEFQLVLSADDNAADVPLLDELLPLHLYRVGDNVTLKIVGMNIMVNLVNQKGSKYFYAFPKRMSIKEMKQKNRLKYDCDISYFSWAFLQQGERYRKLDDEAGIDDVLCDNDVVHFVEDELFPDSQKILIYYNSQEVGRVGWRKEDTALTVKLRVQQQLGFPVACVDLKEDREVFGKRPESWAR